MKVLAVLVLAGLVAAAQARPFPPFLELEESRVSKIRVEHIILCQAEGGASGDPIKGGMYEHKLGCTTWIRPSKALGFLSVSSIPESVFNKTLSLFSPIKNEQAGETFVVCHLQMGSISPVSTQPQGAKCSPFMARGEIVDWIGNQYVNTLEGEEDASGDPSKMTQVYTVCRGNFASVTNNLYVLRNKVGCSNWVNTADARTILDKSEGAVYSIQRSIIHGDVMEKALKAASSGAKVTKSDAVAVSDRQQYMVCRIPHVLKGTMADQTVNADLMAPGECSPVGDAGDAVGYLNKSESGPVSGASRNVFISVSGN